MAHVIAVVGLSLACLATLVNILALSLNFWEKMDIDAQTVDYFSKYVKVQRLKTHWGLWGECTKVGDRPEYQCSEFRIDTGTSKGLKTVLVRGALFVAIFALTASVICMLLKMFVMKEKQPLFKVAWILDLAAGLMSMCGFAIYTSLKVDVSDYMIAFYLSVVAWIIAWIASGLVFAASRKENLDVT